MEYSNRYTPASCLERNTVQSRTKNMHEQFNTQVAAIRMAMHGRDHSRLDVMAVALAVNTRLWLSNGDKTTLESTPSFQLFEQLLLRNQTVPTLLDYLTTATIDELAFRVSVAATLAGTRIQSAQPQHV